MHLAFLAYVLGPLIVGGFAAPAVMKYFIKPLASDDVRSEFERALVPYWIWKIRDVTYPPSGDDVSRIIDSYHYDVRSLETADILEADFSDSLRGMRFSLYLLALGLIMSSAAVGVHEIMGLEFENWFLGLAFYLGLFAAGWLLLTFFVGYYHLRTSRNEFAGALSSIGNRNRNIGWESLSPEEDEEE